MIRNKYLMGNNVAFIFLCVLGVFARHKKPTQYMKTLNNNMFSSQLNRSK
jgi:hypothetical protein